MVHNADVAKYIPNGESPDRIYGLKRTTRLTNLLPKGEKNDDLIDFSEFSPFTEKGQPPLFPFFVLESKSETSNYSSNNIFLQTAFVIRTLLKLQQSLRDRNGPNSQWQEGPLVWFLSHRGPVWQVSAAYIADEDPVYV